MKAISLWQPWAYAVVAGTKKFETRSWRTPYKGMLAIHAAKRFPPEALSFAQTERALDRLPSRLAFGAILGTVRLFGCRDAVEVCSEISALERLYGDYSEGRWAWELRDPVMFDEPIPFKGSQGFFNVPDELLGATVNRQIAQEVFDFAS